MSVLNILERARNIVNHPGWWTQGSLCDGGQVCAMGAIAVADELLELDKKHGPQQRPVVATAVERVTDDMRVDYSADEWGYDEEYYREPAEVVDEILGNGDVPEWLLSEDGVKATCFLSAAIGEKADGVGAHANMHYSQCQTRVISYNDDHKTTQERVVDAFDRAIALARSAKANA